MLSVARERAADGPTPLTFGRWASTVVVVSAMVFVLASLLALLAGAGGYGDPDAGFARAALIWAAGALAVYAAAAVPLWLTERRMHRLYEGPGVPSAADFARARRWAVGWALVAGPALMVPVALLGFAPWWAALPVGLVMFVPVALFVPAPPAGAKL